MFWITFNFYFVFGGFLVVFVYFVDVIQNGEKGKCFEKVCIFPISKITCPQNKHSCLNTNINNSRNKKVN